jgi:transketolase
MRIAFTKTLFEEAQKNKQIILVTADMGFSVFETFRDTLPKQYLNSGIAEQNTTGLAAGLAMEGKIPVIYSIVPFITMRNFEQIRDDICYQNQNVKIVGVGSGFSYGTDGHTHHGLEDIGILRTLANLVILSPADPIEAAQATKWALKHTGPVYIRLGKAGEPILNNKSYVFKKGKGNILKKGSSVCIIATGAITNNALLAAGLLDKKGISTSVVSMTTIKPIDEKLILSLARSMKALVTIEEHSIIGGLGSAVAEILAENKSAIAFKRIGVPDQFIKQSGKQDFMRRMSKLTPQDIVKTVSKMLQE